jgi:hypothetical protein
MLSEKKTERNDMYLPFVNEAGSGIRMPLEAALARTASNSKSSTSCNNNGFSSQSPALRQKQIQFQRVHQAVNPFSSLLPSNSRHLPSK